MLAGTLLIAGGCGGTAKYANAPRPPVPVNLTVYIGASRVSVSPASVGAGPVVFIIANRAASAEALSVAGAGDQPLASTAPINPQGTAQVAVNFSASGDYTVTASGGGIAPARIHIGAARAGGGSVLLQP
jgi:hypothetical protein